MTSDAEAQSRQDAERERFEMREALVRIIVPIWRAQRRLQTDDAGIASICAARMNLERACALLEAIGVTLKDYQGQAYDPGMSSFITPLAFQEHADSMTETVIETIAPATFYRGHIVSKSEVVIGVPIASVDSWPKDGSVEGTADQQEVQLSAAPTDIGSHSDPTSKDQTVPSLQAGDE